MTGKDYEYYDGNQSKFSRRCIDGKFRGCSNCVGYCQFEGHPGFLTKEQRRKKDCIKKNCRYYTQKSPRKRESKNAFEVEIPGLIRKSNEYLRQYEGMKILHATTSASGTVTLQYVSITNSYSIDEISGLLKEHLGRPVLVKKLDYSFDKCAALVFDS